MIILIDNGHGCDTAGKRSPDGQHHEYKWAREFAQRLCTALIGSGLWAQRLVTEESDVSLRERVRRVNDLCAREGSRNVLLLSMHNDAKGSDGQWHTARGFSVRVGLNASARSRYLAACIVESMRQEGVTVRVPSPSMCFWPQNLAICRDTSCPAVLCENLFQDNREDVQLLHDEVFLQKLERAYILAIDKYLFNV